MGMRIGGSNSNWAIQNQSVNNWQQRQSGLKDVLQALKSSDLTGAQQAFNKLNIDTSQMDSNSPLAKLSVALQGGDLSSAQTAAQGLGHHHHHGKGMNVQAGSSMQGSNDPAFMQMVAQSLAAALGQNQSTNSTTATTSASTAGTTVASNPDASQALSSFMQNLMSALTTSSSGTVATNGADSDGDGDTRRGSFAQMLSNPGQASVPSTQDALSSVGNIQGPPSPRFQSYLKTAGGQIQTNVDNLLQQLSSASPNASTSALQNSFGNFVQALGGQSDSTSLSTFLKNLEQNLQLGSTSGNFLSVTA